MIDLLRRASWSVYLPVVLALIVAVILGPIGMAIPAVIAALIGSVVTAFLLTVLRRVRRADMLTEEGQTPESIAGLPASPDFELTQPSESDPPITLSDSAN